MPCSALGPIKKEKPETDCQHHHSQSSDRNTLKSNSQLQSRQFKDFKATEKAVYPQTRSIGLATFLTDKLK